VAHEYRRRAADHGLHDRAIEFFRAAVERDPQSVASRLELSVAYVDKIPTCGGLAAIVCKGTLARKSLDVLDGLLAEDPDSWIARYSRGMNHLHWPRALRHSAEAVEDFQRCLELEPRRHERIYVLLGDAHAKNGSFGEARRVWREGQALFPRSRALVDRLALGDDDAVLTFVERARSLEQPIDTDLSF
jgi:tetratricopeptide (TPR) repeat protein